LYPSSGDINLASDATLVAVLYAVPAVATAVVVVVVEVEVEEVVVMEVVVVVVDDDDDDEEEDVVDVDVDVDNVGDVGDAVDVNFTSFILIFIFIFIIAILLNLYSLGLGCKALRYIRFEGVCKYTEIDTPAGNGNSDSCNHKQSPSSTLHCCNVWFSLGYSFTLLDQSVWDLYTQNSWVSCTVDAMEDKPREKNDIMFVLFV
jgi:hypothetical protein